MTLREMLDQIAASIRGIAGSEYKIYTERLPDTDENKDGAVWINDESLWSELSKKLTRLNIVIIFRFHLDRMIEEGAEYYESNAQGEVLQILQQLVGKTISPGITLEHDKTNCFADEQGRYIIRTELSGYKGG
jgi:hypothetical protein